MFNAGDWDDDDFKSGPVWEVHNHRWVAGGGAVMDIVIGIACLVGIAILLALICRCCCGSRSGGRVLQPPPDLNSSMPGAAPYPQQQYSTVTVAAMPVVHPASATYPGVGAPYPGAGGPYPGAGAPYPTAGAPYPVVAPYPAAPYLGGMPQPQPSAAPTAPDAHAAAGGAPPPPPPGWHARALPPSYDQVMSNEGKHPPFNPYAPH